MGSFRTRSWRLAGCCDGASSAFKFKLKSWRFIFVAALQFVSGVWHFWRAELVALLLVAAAAASFCASSAREACKRVR